MATINLPIHKIKLAELLKSSPTGNIDKLFIQCELASVNGDEAQFSVIVYTADREEKKWNIGKRVQCTPVEKKSFSLDHAIGFANTEVRLRIGKKKYKTETGDKLSHATKPKTNPFDEIWQKFEAKPNLLAEAELTFTPKITNNPHIGFDVTIGVEGRQIQLDANPSPPAPPLDEVILQ